MDKAVPPGSFDFGEAAVALIKVASRGLIGEDRRRLEKRAGSAIADVFRNLEIRPGEVPIHLIALGSDEKYGCNRNADSFPEETCERDHPTFVKHAMFYRHHRNSNPAISYGRVAHSHYNAALSRIELIAALNGTKEAARRNGGLVADEELECLEKGAEIPVSMATAIPHDVCSGCGNKARVKSEYCDARRCTKYGGLKDNVGRTFEDGHTLRMMNVINRWKDISMVGKPADRIAYAMGRLENAAAAAARPGLAWGDHPSDFGFSPELLAAPRLSAQSKVAAALARACATPSRPALILAFSGPADFAGLRSKAASVLSASAVARATLPLEGFFALASGDPAAAKAAATAVAPFVPGSYAELLAEGGPAFASNPFSCWGPAGMAGVRSLESCRLDKTAVARRAATASLVANPPNVSRIHAPGRGPYPAVAAAARQYALYKVAALAPLADDPDFEGLVAAAAAQDLAAILTH